MKPNKIIIAMALALGAGSAFAAEAAEGFQIKGSVQAHGQKKVHDENVPYSLLDKYYMRANLGAKYVAEDVNGEFNIRAYPKQFGNKLVTDVDSTGKNTKKDYDNFIIETAVVELTPNKMLAVRAGHWLTNYSIATHFGNYIDQDPRLPAAVFFGRVAYHDAVEMKVKTGILSSSVLVGGTDKNMNTGYVRVVESVKLANPKLVADVGWRANVLDSLAFPDAEPELMNRLFVRVLDTLMPGLMPYAEYGAIQIMNEDGDKEFKHVAMLGVQVPTGLKSLQLNVEGEWLQDYEVADSKGKMQDRAIDWNVALKYKAGKRTTIHLYTWSDPTASSALKPEVGSRITVALD